MSKPIGGNGLQIGLTLQTNSQQYFLVRSLCFPGGDHEDHATKIVREKCFTHAQISSPALEPKATTTQACATTMFSTQIEVH